MDPSTRLPRWRFRGQSGWPNSFDTEKFVLTFATTNGARQISLWTLDSGIVFAMEDSRFAAGLRVLLSQHKKFSDF